MSSVRALFRFFGDSYHELKQVTWLSRNQMIASTWLVIIFIFAFAIYVGFLDLLVSRLFRLFI